MSYNPEDHQVTFARMTGPLVLWACALLALIAMGPQGSPAPAEPVLLAAPCSPLYHGTPVPPFQDRGVVVEVHAS